MTTKRQYELLDLIVSIYIKSGEPVSSASILLEYPKLSISSATIRNEMSNLEKEEYIRKLDSSSKRNSGRIPTNKGYEFYLKKIKTNPDSFLLIKKELDKILDKRNENIDELLREALNLISYSTNTLTISKDSKNDVKILDINCYQIKKANKVVVIIVTSDGDVIKNETNLLDIEYDNFKKVILIYAKRLRDTLVKDIDKTLNYLNEIVSLEIKGLEEKFQKLFKLLINKILNSPKYYQGMNSLILANNINIKTQISTILKMIENNSIWNLISNEGKILNDVSGVTIDVDVVEGMSVVNKSINIDNEEKHLTVIGSKNQNYEKLFSMLEYLEKKITGGKNEQ